MFACLRLLALRPRFVLMPTQPPRSSSSSADARESQPLISTASKYRAIQPAQHPAALDGLIWTQSLWSRSNIAIVTSYFMVGFTGSFMSTPLSVYMIKELGASPSEQNTIGILMSVPWSFKLVYGFTSDTFKLFGYRRKSYLLVGYVIYAFAMLYLAYVRTPTVVQLASVLFLSTVGLICADVSADTMIVERSQHEPEHKRGQSQATCYSIRFGGSIAGSLAGCLLYNRETWGWGLTFEQVCAVNG